MTIHLPVSSNKYIQININNLFINGRNYSVTFRKFLLLLMNHSEFWLTRLFAFLHDSPSFMHGFFELHFWLEHSGVSFSDWWYKAFYHAVPRWILFNLVFVVHLLSSWLCFQLMWITPRSLTCRGTQTWLHDETQDWQLSIYSVQQHAENMFYPRSGASFSYVYQKLLHKLNNSYAL